MPPRRIPGTSGAGSELGISGDILPASGPEVQEQLPNVRHLAIEKLLKVLMTWLLALPSSPQSLQPPELCLDTPFPQHATKSHKTISNRRQNEGTLS